VKDKVSTDCYVVYDGDWIDDVLRLDVFAEQGFDNKRELKYGICEDGY
jgi:hypothetical protein